MKSISRLLVSVIMATCLCFSCTENVQAQAIGLERVKGSGMAKEKAIENAKQRAVEKALLTFLSENQNEMMEQLLAGYSQYVVGEPTVIKTEKFNGKLLMICDVQVDYARIENDIHAINRQQRQNNSELPVFLIRLAGFPADLIQKNQHNNALQEYQQAFVNYGFNVKDSNRVGEEIRGMVYGSAGNSSQHPEYNAYKAMIQDALKGPKGMMVGMAVIGELRLVKVTPVGNGYYAEVAVNTDVISRPKGSNDFALVGNIENKYYNASQQTEVFAMEQAMQNATINSARYLAEIVAAKLHK